jgi:hypothetical protein
MVHVTSPFGSIGKATSALLLFVLCQVEGIRLQYVVILVAKSAEPQEGV